MIPTYYSHSYRVEDRELNIFFWELFHKHGFAFTVDSQSGQLSTPHLELTMKRSACFVAVVTCRDDEPRYRCSPFARYEFGLAVQAGTRSLILAERDVPARLFPESPRRRLLVFNRDRLRNGSELVHEVATFAQLNLPFADSGDLLSGDVGLILPTGEGYEECRADLVEMLDSAGYAARSVRLDVADAADLDQELERYDFVIMDVASPALPAWLLGMIRGRSVPTIPVARLLPDATRPAVPVLAMDSALHAERPAHDQVVYWGKPADLLVQLEQHVLAMRVPRRQFMSLNEGNQYFYSLGRASSGPVFLSNVGVDDGIALQIARAFDLHNISYFHYLYRNTIPKGVDWEDRVLPMVGESTVFVALVSEQYWSSEWCRREFDYAEKLRKEGGLIMLPYFLDRSGSHPVPAQGTTVHHLPPGQQVATIIREVDRLLVAGAV